MKVRFNDEEAWMSGGLHKDPSILEVLDRLRSRLGEEAFVIADRWEADLFAVGIAAPHDLGVLVYISTYGYLPERFGYELELPPEPGDDFPYRVAGRGAKVSFEELACVVANHLNPSESNTSPDQ